MVLDGEVAVAAGALGSQEFGDGPYLLVAVGLLLSFLTVHVLWRVFRANGSEGDVPDQHHRDGMIVCPNCGEPTENEYRFCRVCAGDTGKGVVDMVEGDDSSQSGMF
jgi:hypothetical protein